MKAPVITVTTSSLPKGNYRQPYPGATVTASGGSGSYKFTETGLPKGLRLDETSGVISGTPTQAGTFTVIITAKDTTSSKYDGPFTGTKSLTLTVTPPTITVTTSSLPAGTQGQSYGPGSLTASGGDLRYTFTATGLPSGLSVTGSAITGVPTEHGTFSVSITASDHTPSADGGPFTSAPKPLTLKIAQKKCYSPPWVVSNAL